MNGRTSTPGSSIAELREIGQWLSSVLDLRNVLEFIIDRGTKRMRAKASSLLLVNPKAKKLYFEVATGEAKDEVRKFEINIGQGIAGWVAQKGETLLIQDVNSDPRWYKQISESIGFKTCSILCVPLKTDDEIIGVMEMIDKEDGSPFQEEDKSILEAFAALAAQAISNAKKIKQFTQENIDLKEELWKKYQIIGDSALLKKAISDALKVANSKTSTMILGESGTGKELLARRIHENGSRKKKPLIILNCAALPETLLEAELFGHEKGAFTGALTQKNGKFELADEGTLFLDEIGEMTPSMQAKLLGVLQEGVFYRVGGNTPITVDVRMICATNKDIAREVAEGRFREDLYYRLNVVQIRMPALRERREDITPLVDYFLTMFKQERGFLDLPISKGAMDKMLQYDWPGNVRELRNAIERAVVMGNGKEVLLEDLPIGGEKTSPPALELGLSLKEAENRFKKEFICVNLKYHNGNRSKAAKTMGIQRTYLSRLISKYGLQGV